MKKCVFLTCTFLSLLVFAKEPKRLDSDSIAAINDIVGAIQSTPEAATFSKNVRFNEITIDFSADGNDSIINAKGAKIVGGDMLCGFLGLQIKRSSKFYGWFYEPVYEASLDVSELYNEPHCKLK